MSDTHDSADDFFEQDYGHDLMYDIHPLPGSSKSPTLNNPSSSLFAYSDNLHFNQEITTNTFNSTECTSMNSDQYPHTNNLEGQTNMSSSSLLHFTTSSLDPYNDS